MGEKHQPSVEEYFDIRHITQKELDLLLFYLTGRQKSTALLEYHFLFPAREVLSFLSLFQGRSFKVPRVNTLNRYRNYIQVYAFVEKRSFSQSSFEEASLRFKKKLGDVKRIVKNVRKFIRDGEKVLEKEEKDGD